MMIEKYERLKKIVMNYNYVNQHEQGIYLCSEELLELIKQFLNSESRTVLIPNMALGELSLCVDQAITFCKDEKLVRYLQEEGILENCKVVKSDFLSYNIENKYDRILAIPPFGVKNEYGRIEEAYLKRSLDLLAYTGRLIIILPNNYLWAPAFKKYRSRIITEYSLEAVLPMSSYFATTRVPTSMLIIDNKPQTEKVYMPNSLNNYKDAFMSFRNQIGNEWVEASIIEDRFDATYYNPKYKMIREKIENRDTIHLGETAAIFQGSLFKSEDRLVSGDYLIIKPENIYDGTIHLDFRKDTNRKIIKTFCNENVVLSNEHYERSVIKPGDILISLCQTKSWAIYNDEVKHAVANQHIAIVRVKSEFKELLDLFLNSKTGIAHLEKQLEFFSQNGSGYITRQEVSSIAIPDQSVLETVNHIRKGSDLEARVVDLFKNYGWEVKENFKIGNRQYDIALLLNGKLHGVIEVKNYSSFQIERNKKLIIQLDRIKAEILDVPLYLFIDDSMYEYSEGRFNILPEIPRPQTSHAVVELEEILKSEKKRSNTFTQYEDENIFQNGTFSLSDMVIIEWLNTINQKLDNISEKLDILSKRIENYQSLVSRQISLASSDEEIEHIIHSYSEECVERIQQEFHNQEVNKSYNEEKMKLINSFGDSAWEKLDESSRKFLTTAKVMFNKLVECSDLIDYSGVCLSVTKALELEMSKRFHTNFIYYLKKHYPGKANYSQFPTALLDKYGHPKRAKDFTLGTVPYVLCYLGNDDDEQTKNNKAKLIEYSKEELFKGKSDEEILSILERYGEEVEEVKNNYRNPSAHTNKLGKVDAEECFAYVLDVEKILKEMLDSFDK